MNDFLAHLIISKWLRKQIADRKENQCDKKTSKRKKKLSTKSVFIYLNTQ